MVKWVSDIGVERSTHRLAVHENFGYNSFVLKIRQVLTDKSEGGQKLKYQALLNDIKQNSTPLLRFSSDEKNSIQDQNLNPQNSRMRFKDPLEMPTVRYMKYSGSGMGIGDISSESHFMPTRFFEADLKTMADAYVHVLGLVGKSFINIVAAVGQYMFQLDSSLAPKVRETQASLYTSLSDHLSPNVWSPSTPLCILLDYYNGKIFK